MSPAPDLIVANVNVVTLDPRCPRAGLVAVREGRIVHVGQGDELPYLSGPGTRVIDGQGLTLVPGFNDAHLHFLALASSLRAVDCSRRAVHSIIDIQLALRKRARETPSGRWVRARGYDEAFLLEGRNPTRQELDQAAARHPVRLDHRSGHACVLNTLGLAQVAIGQDTPDPPEGVIVRDEGGEPAGLLLEMGDYVSQRIQSRHEDLEESIAGANRLLLSLGVTSFQDASPSNTPERFDLLREMKLEGRITPRVTLMPGEQHLAAFCQRGLHHGSGDGDMRLGAAKIVLTATTGTLQPPPEALRLLVREACGLGYPVAIHAVEAEAVEAAVEALREGDAMALGPSLRHRIEHCSECPTHLLEHLRQCGAVVVTQPTFLYHSGERYLKEVSQEVQPHLYPVSAWRKAGIAVAFSSDAPVAPASPLEGVYAAVTRRADTGEAIAPDEAIGAEEALELYTLGSAYAAAEESLKGSIQQGKLADLVLLDNDPTAVEPEAIKEIKVRMTMVGGEVVWEG